MANSEIGEYIVGAYLEFIKNCDVIQYNVRFKGGKLKGLSELDIIGLNYKNQIAYLAEVTTHIRGTLYNNYDDTIKKIDTKHKVQINYFDEYLKPLGFKPYYMFWSPIVPKGIETRLFNMSDLILVINKKYSNCVLLLEEHAKKHSNPTNNPFYRTLQILGFKKDADLNLSSLKEDFESFALENGLP